MSTEIAPAREGEQRSHPAAAGDADPFKNYRMGSDSGPAGNPATAGVGTGAGADSMKPRTFLPADGQLTIPPLNYGDAGLKSPGTTALQPQTDAEGPKTDAAVPKTDAAGPKTDNAPAKAAGYDHVVQHKDSLWKLAETSLGKDGDHKASPNQIWNQVQNIIKANKNEHPQLQKNPHMLHDGIKLHIPEPRKAGDNQNGAQGQGHAAVRQPQEGQHERRHQRHNPASEKGAENGSETTPRRAQPDHITPQPPRKKEVAPEVTPRENGAHPGDHADDGGRLVHAIKQLGRDIAKTAVDIAHSLGTIGDCARGPRLAFKEQGLHLKPAVATEQGRQIRESGLFTKLKPGETPQPGDYGVRDWNRSVIRAHGGVNKGDSFIVTSVAKDGTMHGANDHRFVVPPDGGRYRNLQFYRPNAEFLRRYGNT